MVRELDDWRKKSEEGKGGGEDEGEVRGCEGVIA
jgi:hypothetical protein